MYKKIIDEFYQWRSEVGLTVRQAAAAIGCSHSDLNRVENYKKKASERMLAKMLRCLEKRQYCNQDRQEDI